MYKIADSHTHIYPVALAEKARRSIFDFYEFPYENREGMGTAPFLVQDCAAGNISKALVCSVAGSVRVVDSINNFVMESYHGAPDLLVPFATIHPDCTDKYQMLVRLKERGFFGLKFHPDIQKFEMDSPICDEVYCACSDLQLPILMHCGDPRVDTSSPKRLRNVADRFPDLQLIGAHFGGYSCWEEAIDLADRPNILLDTSSSIQFVDKDMILRFFERYGKEKFLFGSDYPLTTPREEVARFLALGLPEEVNRAVLYGNFCHLFGL